MSVKLFLILSLTLFLSLTNALLASAENEAPNFSAFEEPDASKASQSKSKTEAAPPCITCDQEHSKSIKQKSLEAVAKKVGTSNSSCITCGRVSINDTQSKKRANSGKTWNHHPEITAYSNSSAVNAMIKYAERHARKRSGGNCYRSVKEALCGAPKDRGCKGPLVNKYIYGTPVFPEVPSQQKHRLGKNAIVSLKSEGFINLLDKPEFSEIIRNPATAPKGAILVYKGGYKGGHIEIKTGHGTDGSYISDFSAPNSVMKNELGGRASKNYKLVAVMIKPAGKI